MLAYIIGSVFIFFVHSASIDDSCSSWQKCRDCIRDPSLCVWCAMNDFNGTRCVAKTTYKDNWCKGKIENPANSINALKDEEFRSGLDHVVQIKPQQYKMELRPGVPQSFNFSFLAAKDYPVDLYFLLDASLSMKKVKDATAKQSENIYNTLKSMTKNVYLGLGTFVDKMALPFISTFNSTETYSFRHCLKLSDDIKEFKKVLTETSFGKNRDEQEGGLDALAQVMTCNDLIGWRNDSRKIVVFVTDGPYHAAGDGKLAGIFQPYDGKCYSQNGTYSKELEMDYPSVGIINKLAMDQNIIILFYIGGDDPDVPEIYKKLSNELSGSHFSDSNQDEIVPKLKEIYESISTKIILKTIIKAGNRKNIDIAFVSDCTKTNLEMGSECDIEIGKEKQIEGTVKLLKYDGQDKVSIDIEIESIDEELNLDIDVVSTCDCEDNIEESSTVCHGKSRFCGICNCEPDRYGKNCVCLKNTDNSFNGTVSTCIREGNEEACSGHGSCVCDACECWKGYSGKFCECSSISCLLGKGQLCSGEDHGKCVCGQCDCKPDWYGDACECPKAGCVHNDKVCNGHGDCKCGVCHCHQLAEWDKRNFRDPYFYCEIADCPDCHNSQCRSLEDCVICRRMDNKTYCSSCHDLISIRVVTTLPAEYFNSSSWKVCTDIKVGTGCYTSFVYRYDNEKYTLELVAQEEKNCAENYYYIGYATLGVIVVIGILTLVAWKLLTDARDRREYQQFLESAKNEEYNACSNPLYTSPQTKVNNPQFGKRSITR